jgi:hypothetical protein
MKRKSYTLIRHVLQQNRIVTVAVSTVVELIERLLFILFKDMI